MQEIAWDGMYLLERADCTTNNMLNVSGSHFVAYFEQPQHSS